MESGEGIERNVNRRELLGQALWNPVKELKVASPALVDRFEDIIQWNPVKELKD